MFHATRVISKNFTGTFGKEGNNALGFEDEEAVTLGVGGWIQLEFPFYITDASEIEVVEIGPNKENVEVYVSNEELDENVALDEQAVPIFYLGKVRRAKEPKNFKIDIENEINKPYQYLIVRDIPEQGKVSGDRAGADIDAVNLLSVPTISIENMTLLEGTSPFFQAVAEPTVSLSIRTFSITVGAHLY